MTTTSDCLYVRPSARSRTTEPNRIEQSRTEPKALDHLPLDDSDSGGSNNNDYNNSDSGKSNGNGERRIVLRVQIE